MTPNCLDIQTQAYAWKNTGALGTYKQNLNPQLHFPSRFWGLIFCSPVLQMVAIKPWLLKTLVILTQS